MERLTATPNDIYWKEDPLGFFTIKPFPEEGVIRVRYYRHHTLLYIIRGKTPEELYYTITSLKLISRMEHAAYLGKELEKAYLAMKYNLAYVQDDPLDLHQHRSQARPERRIISLAPSNTEILYALGLGKNIIATTRFCDYPAGAKKKTKVGGWVDVNLVEVKKMQADLVLTSSFVQDKVVRDAKKFNINIVHTDPKTLADVYESILIIGELTERNEEAQGVVREMKEKISAQQKKVRPGTKPRVYIEEWHEPPHVSGNWVPELVEMAGGIYRVQKKGQISRTISTAEIKRYNPEIIILSWCGFGTKANPKIVRQRPGWEKLEAVKNNHIYVVDDSLLNRPGPRLVEGFKFLVEKINKYKKGKK